MVYTRQGRPAVGVAPRPAPPPLSLAEHNHWRCWEVAGLVRVSYGGGWGEGRSLPGPFPLDGYPGGRGHVTLPPGREGGARRALRRKGLPCTMIPRDYHRKPSLRPD